MQVQSYLFFNGRCEEALGFYRDAIGAEVLMQLRFNEAPPDPNHPIDPAAADKIMHSTFRVGDTELMASDGRLDGSDAPHSGYSLSLTADDAASGEKFFNALAAGGEVVMPWQATFWSKGFGILLDRFGVRWMVTIPHEGTRPQA